MYAILIRSRRSNLMFWAKTSVKVTESLWLRWMCGVFGVDVAGGGYGAPVD